MDEQPEERSVSIQKEDLAETTPIGSAGKNTPPKKAAGSNSPSIRTGLAPSKLYHIFARELEQHGTFTLELERGTVSHDIIMGTALGNIWIVLDPSPLVRKRNRVTCLAKLSSGYIRFEGSVRAILKRTSKSIYHIEASEILGSKYRQFKILHHEHLLGNQMVKNPPESKRKRDNEAEEGSSSEQNKKSHMEKSRREKRQNQSVVVLDDPEEIIEKVSQLDRSFYLEETRDHPEEDEAEIPKEKRGTSHKLWLCLDFSPGFDQSYVRSFTFKRNGVHYRFRATVNHKRYSSTHTYIRAGANSSWNRFDYLESSFPAKKSKGDKQKGEKRSRDEEDGDEKVSEGENCEEDDDEDEDDNEGEDEIEEEKESTAFKAPADKEEARRAYNKLHELNACTPESDVFLEVIAGSCRKTQRQYKSFYLILDYKGAHRFEEDILTIETRINGERLIFKAYITPHRASGQSQGNLAIFVHPVTPRFDKFLVFHVLDFRIPSSRTYIPSRDKNHKPEQEEEIQEKMVEVQFSDEVLEINAPTNDFGIGAWVTRQVSKQVNAAKAKIQEDNALLVNSIRQEAGSQIRALEESHASALQAERNRNQANIQAAKDAGFLRLQLNLEKARADIAEAKLADIDQASIQPIGYSSIQQRLQADIANLESMHREASAQVNDLRETNAVLENQLNMAKQMLDDMQPRFTREEALQIYINENQQQLHIEARDRLNDMLLADAYRDILKQSPEIAAMLQTGCAEAIRSGQIP